MNIEIFNSVGSFAAVVVIAVAICLTLYREWRRARRENKALTDARDWRDADRRARHALMAYVSRMPAQATFFGELFRLRVPHINRHYPEVNFPDHYAQKGEHLIYSASPTLDPAIGVQVQVKLKGEVLVNEFIEEYETNSLDGKLFFSKLMTWILCKMADAEKEQQSRVDQGYSLEALREVAYYPRSDDEKEEEKEALCNSSD
jgi:hypothetical protein